MVPAAPLTVMPRAIPTLTGERKTFEAVACCAATVLSSANANRLSAATSCVSPAVRLRGRPVICAGARGDVRGDSQATANTTGTRSSFEGTRMIFLYRAPRHARRISVP